MKTNLQVLLAFIFTPPFACCITGIYIHPSFCMQFHAVALLHALRATDRLAISKLVTSLVRGSVRSPLAQCLVVRYVAQVSLPNISSHPIAWITEAS